MFGYFKVDRRNNILDVVDIDTPPYIRDTHGFWLDVPYTCINILNSKKIHVAASIHAAEHALLSLTPMFVMSVSGDVRTECKPPEKEFAKTKTSRVRPARSALSPSCKTLAEVEQIDSLRCARQGRRDLRQSL